jgi:hypothetical protein
LILNPIVDQSIPAVTAKRMPKFLSVIVF